MPFCLTHWPSNKGQKCLQQVMHPWDVNCPMAVSRRNIGIPQASRNNTYGTKNAPERKVMRRTQNNIGDLIMRHITQVCWFTCFLCTEDSISEKKAKVHKNFRWFAWWDTITFASQLIPLLSFPWQHLDIVFAHIGSHSTYRIHRFYLVVQYIFR